MKHDFSSHTKLLSLSQTSTTQINSEPLLISVQLENNSWQAVYNFNDITRYCLQVQTVCTKTYKETVKLEPWTRAVWTELWKVS